MTPKQLTLLLVTLIVLGIVAVAGRALIAPPSAIQPIPSPSAAPVVTVATTTLTVSLGQKVGDSAVSITPMSVLEDSRCPLGVQCIQAGTVRVQAEVTAEGTTTEQMFVLNQAMMIGSRTIALTDVTPARNKGAAPVAADYIFTFEVAN